MGQVPATGTLSPEACERLRGLRLDEVLRENELLRQTSCVGATAPCRYYRLCFVAPRETQENDEWDCQVSGLRFWDQGQEIRFEDVRITSTKHTGGDLDVKLSTEGVVSSSTNITSIVVVIVFHSCTAVTEFAFRTNPEEDTTGNDPVKFAFEGSVDGKVWIRLHDQTGPDFPTPRARGAWTPTISLGNPATETLCGPNEARRAARKLSRTTKDAGARQLALWLSAGPPKTPAEEAEGLLDCCRARLLRDRQRRRELLFPTLHAACESAARHADEEAAKLAEPGVAAMNAAPDPAAARSSTMWSVSMRCAVRLLLEPGFQGPQAGFMLEMINEEVAAGMAELMDMHVRLPAKASELPESLVMGLATASDVLRKALHSGHEQGPRIAELLLRSSLLRGAWTDLLAAVGWLCSDAASSSDLSKCWQLAQSLYGMMSPCSIQDLDDEGRWTREEVPARTAVCSNIILTEAHIQSLTTSAYVEVVLKTCLR